MREGEREEIREKGERKGGGRRRERRGRGGEGEEGEGVGWSRQMKRNMPAETKIDMTIKIVLNK